MRFGTRALVSVVAGVMLSSGALGAEGNSHPGKVRSTAQTDGATVTSLRLAPDLLRFEGQKLALPRNVELVVGPGAVAKPTFTSLLPVGDRGSKVPVQTVEVETGRVDAVLSAANMGRGVLLQGPSKIIAISTHGRVGMSVTEDTVVIAALSGDVLVGQDSRFKSLPEGSIRLISRASGVFKDAPMPGKPTLVSDKSLHVALSGPVTVPLLSTSKSPLRVIVVDDHGTPIGRPWEIPAGGNLSVVVPQAGTYYALAREIGEAQVAGPLSEPVKIQVLGLAEGEREPVGGVFLLDQGERVRLAGTEGLEVRYDSSPIYVPASTSYGLSQPRETRVEFRNPLDPEQKAVLRLAPKILKKELELGPAEARWPGAPVKVRVGFWDGAGKLLRDGNDLDVRVTVNSVLVKVDWKVTKDGLVADLNKQTGEGPWVVRVNVLDKRGRTIARDFLEVASR
jgi:hypothetical protein